MYYTFKSNVYFVQGAARGCVYDFNHSRLYSVNKALSEKLDLVRNGAFCTDSMDVELKRVFEHLVNLEILTLSECPIYHRIEEIALPDKGCSFAWIEITNKCNLRCLHCYNESEPQCDVVMSVKDYKIVVDNLVGMGITKVQIIGGEPFLQKQLLKEMIDYTIGKFSFIEIFTNGTLLDAEWYDYLLENNIHIALSVYSYNDEMHDRVTRSKGSWKRTNETIRALKHYGISYRVCNVLMKGIELGGQSTELYTLSTDKDIVRLSGRASFSLLSDDLLRKKLITKRSFETPIRKSFAARLLSGHNCFRDKLYIAANLEVFPCVMERRLKHCNINQHGKIVLDDSIRSFTKDEIDECCYCEYRYACFDCRPNSLSGVLHEKPWYCTYNPLLGEWEDEDAFITKLKKTMG